MKRAMLGLTVLAGLGCASSNRNVMEPKSLSKRVIEESVKGCNELSSSRYGIYFADVGGEEYLIPSEIARVDKIVQEKTDCHLSVYFDRERGNIGYVVEKGNPEFLIKVFLYESRYVKHYPFMK